MAYYTYQLRGLGSTTAQSSTNWSNPASVGEFFGGLGEGIASVVTAAKGTSAETPTFDQPSSIGNDSLSPGPGSSAANMTSGNGSAAMMSRGAAAGGVPWYVYAGGGLLALLVLSRFLAPKANGGF